MHNLFGEMFRPAKNGGEEGTKLSRGDEGKKLNVGDEETELNAVEKVKK